MNKCGERAPEVCWWVKHVVDDGVGGGGGVVGEVPMEAEV
jgi:hypothetical protein